MGKDDTSIKFDYEVVENDFIRAGEASSHIKKVMTKLGIDPKIIRKVAIATYEAEMNIVIHSCGGQLIITILPEGIKIEACDNGPGIADIDLAMQQGYSTASNKVRELGFGAGMGLPNMKRYSDAFEIDSTVGVGTKLMMHIYFDDENV